MIDYTEELRLNVFLRVQPDVQKGVSDFSKKETLHKQPTVIVFLEEMHENHNGCMMGHIKVLSIQTHVNEKES